MKPKAIRIVALTDEGKCLGETLRDKLPHSALWYKPQPFAEKVQRAFNAGDSLIFICATGIVVRTLAPVIKSKYKDPPVLVLDEQGKYVIPLLSGHEGGANNWAAEVADIIHARAVITTAKNYLQPVYTLGMGCERHCPQEELQTLLETCLTQAQLSLEQVESINSIDIKADETGLITLAKHLDKPYRTYHKDELIKVNHLLSTQSEYVYNTVGVYGVAESAALWAAQMAAGDEAELVLNKQKTAKATCAIARAYKR